MCVVLLCVGCTTAESPAKTAHTVCVMSEGGLPLSKVGVFVYADESQSDILWAGETDESGTVEFDAVSGRHTVVLKDVPLGYETKASYTTTGQNTLLRLPTELLDGSKLANYRLGLGDVMCDFTVTVKGVTYTLSELLSKRKAVVLNFWFEGCNPCRMEFPYLQKAYEAYAADVAVLAINPLDGNDASVKAYAQQMGLTFPTIAGESGWQSCFMLNAYPTTVVIDRYGTIAMIHKGAVTEEGVFEAVFDHFIATDYVQSTVQNISELV